MRGDYPEAQFHWPPLHLSDAVALSCVHHQSHLHIHVLFIEVAIVGGLMMATATTRIAYGDVSERTLSIMYN